MCIILQLGVSGYKFYKRLVVFMSSKWDINASVKVWSVPFMGYGWWVE